MILKEFLSTWVDRNAEVNEPGGLDPTSPLTVPYSINCTDCQSQHLISSFHFTIQDKHLCSLCNSYTADNGSSIKTINTLWIDKEIKLQQNTSNILRKKKKKKRLTTYFLQTLFNDFKHNRLQNNTVGKKSFRNFDFHEGSWFWHVIIAAPRDFFNLWIINKYSSI